MVSKNVKGSPELRFVRVYNPDHPPTQHQIVFQAVSLKGKVPELRPRCMLYLNLAVGLVCCPEAEEDDELLPGWRDVSLWDDRLH